MGKIGIKRIYEPADRADGQRILVDRLWPRGVSKKEAELTEWCKDIAPSPALRKWFGHDPARFDEFRDRYRKELDGNGEAVAALCDRAAKGDLTLLYGAHDETCNHAVVLAQYLRAHCR
ncbi:DUF488 domain-containing protein [Sphingobium cloacae]|uniref:Uroporphyrin-III C-methyltransferase n=1 Tax=Sphingobium cloacae TaxID=120107 RepID=A0A1E1F6A9_9SPHN|nr:DUF488 domain-containing protein [Sphingobium cloacae]BAV66055.1 uroporphyrin-III C-methyltransferase [Sphingobium cloacae]